MVTKEGLSRKFVAKDVIKNKIITVACQIFFEYEKKARYFKPNNCRLRRIYS